MGDLCLALLIEQLGLEGLNQAGRAIWLGLKKVVPKWTLVNGTKD